MATDLKEPKKISVVKVLEMEKHGFRGAIEGQGNEPRQFLFSKFGGMPAEKQHKWMEEINVGDTLSVIANLSSKDNKYYMQDIIGKMGSEAGKAAAVEENQMEDLSESLGEDNGLGSGSSAPAGKDNGNKSSAEQKDPGSKAATETTKPAATTEGAGSGNGSEQPKSSYKSYNQQKTQEEKDYWKARLAMDEQKKEEVAAMSAYKSSVEIIKLGVESKMLVPSNFHELMALSMGVARHIQDALGNGTFSEKQKMFLEKANNEIIQAKRKAKAAGSGTGPSL